MSGLLYKEWVTFWRAERLFLLVLLVSAAVPLLRTYGAAFAGLLPFTLIQMDEQAGWGRHAVTLPWSDLQLVLPKYLLGWGLALFMALCSTVALMISGTTLAGALAQGLILVAAVSLLNAVICPIAFGFGARRGRLFFSFLVVIFGFTFTGYGGEISAALSALPWLGGLLLLAVVSLNALSVYLSQRWYRRGTRAQA